MRLLIISLAAVATALGTTYGLHLLFPIDTSVDVDRNLVTAEQVLDRPLKPAPLPSGRLLMPADEIVIDVTPPEQGRLSEDMSAPDADLADTTAPDDDSDRLTADALRLAALADAEADTTGEVPGVTAANEAGSSTAESESTTADATAVDPAAEASTPPADSAVGPTDTTPQEAEPVPTASKAPTATPASSKAPVPTATARPDPAPPVNRSPTPEPTRAAVDAPAGSPGGTSTLDSGKPLTPHVIAPSSHDIDARSRPTAPVPTAAPPAPRRPATRLPPPPSPAQDDNQADAWWLRPTTPSQLGVVHVGTAGFNRAIVLITVGGFSSVESIARNVEVLRGGIVIEGQWSISPANDHLAIFPLVHAGDYDITVGAGLQDRNGRVWPHTVRGTISVP